VSRRLVIAVVMGMCAASSALADAPMVATLAKATLPQKQILGSTIWRCAETTCTSTSAAGTTGLQACRAVAKRFGQIVSFISDDGELDQEKLTKCNEGY
jgi:hypothetical protein